MRLLLLLSAFFLFSCSTWKESLVKVGDKDDAIRNAILDFTHSDKLFSQDSVFNISVRIPLEKIFETENSVEWIPDEEHRNIIGITILGADHHTYIKSDFWNEHVRVPTRYFIEQGKLFLLWDNETPLTQEVIDIYYQFNLVESNEDEAMTIIDDGKNGVDYYFCRDEISKYRKVSTNKAMGTYKVPRLKCPKNEV